jgi:hypothetical protein
VWIRALLHPARATLAPQRAPLRRVGPAHGPPPQHAAGHAVHRAARLADTRAPQAGRVKRIRQPGPTSQRD